MAIIDQYRNLHTVIVEFKVKKGEAEQLVDKMRRFLPVLKAQPGFVSANIHTSLDGKKVVNYSQWLNLESYENFKNNQEVQQQAAGLEEFKSTATEVKVVIAT